MRVPFQSTGLLALLLAAFGCGEDGGCTGDDPSNAAAPENVPPPEAMIWEGSFGGGREGLGSLRSLLPSPVATFIPSTPVGLLERLVPDVPLSDAIAADADVHGLAVRIDDDDHVVLAARARLAEGAQPLGEDVSTIEGAPHGGRFLGGLPAAGAPVAMILGDVIVVGRSPEAVERAAPYLVYELVPREAPAGFVFRLPAGLVSEDLRALADDALRSETRRALAAIQAERARRQAPPEYGDPEELVRALSSAAQRIVAYLPDVGETRLWIRATPGGLALDVDAAITRRSPLAKALEEMPSEPPLRLAALPEDVALAWSTRTMPDDEASFVAETLERTAGDRLGEDAREHLRAADRALGQSRGAGVVTALGGGDSGAWALMATGPARAPFEEDVLRRVLGAPFFREVAAALLGCEAPLAPGEWTTPAEGVRHAALCDSEDADSPTLVVAAAGQALAVGIVRGEASGLEGLAARLLTEQPRGGFGDHPDVARALGSLEGSDLATGAIVPSRILAAAGLYAIGPLRAASEAAAGDAGSAPVVWGLGTTDGGLRLRVIATTSALRSLFQLASPFLSSD